MALVRKVIKRLLLAAIVLVVALNWTWGRLPAEPTLPPGSSFAEVDGVRMHYVETPGSGPGVVMVHGHPGTWLDWQRTQQRLPGVRTIAVDRPGFGLSSGGYLPFERQVEVIRGLAEQLGMEHPVVLGHSYGGALALAWGLQHPQSTAAVIAVDPAFDVDVIDNLARLQARALKLMDLPIVRQLAHVSFSQLFLTAASIPQVKEAFDPDAVIPEYRDQLRAVNLKSSDLRTFADETLSFKRDVGPSAARFTEVTVPTWVLQGLGDRLTPAPAVLAGARQIRDAQVVELSGGHMQPWVHPQEVADAVRDALKTTTRAAAKKSAGRPMKGASR